MGKRNLKEWVLPVLAIIVLIGAIFCYYLINNIINYNVTNDLTYITDPIIEDTTEVYKEINDIVQLYPIRPYSSDKVTISKYFYDQSSEESRQQSSLIKYENIYMPNTGVLYSSEEKFDILASTDGTITKIKEDKILGNIIEVEYSNQLILVYQSVSDIKVKEGDTIKQGDLLASSGSNKLENVAAECLHFEVYKDGNLINPEEFYNLDLNSLN